MDREEIQQMIREEVKMVVGEFFGDNYVASRHFQLLDGRNIRLGKSTGTIIGTATDQKLGFFNTTPVVQPSNPGTASGCTGNADTIVNNVSSRLRDLGIFA